MTCIAGYVADDGEVFIGSDSSGWNSETLDYMLLTEPKVFQRGDMIFGFAQSIRIGQILKYSFIIPKRKPGFTDMEYLCSIFIPNLIKTVETLNASNISDNVAAINGTFLLGYNGHLYQIDNGFQVLEDTKNYMSCGAGENFAKGAFYIIENSPQLRHFHPIEKVKFALEASESFSAVKAPFHIISIAIKKEKGKKKK